MGEIDDAIERADREVFTKDPPKTLQGRINYLISLDDVSARLG